MSVFINVDTGEYPRYPGDVALNPGGNFEQVIKTPPPDFDYDTQTADLAAPEKRNGVWYMTWVVRDLTPEEITARQEALAVLSPSQPDLTAPGTAPDVIG